MKFDTEIRELLTSIGEGSIESITDNKDKIEQLSDKLKSTPIYQKGGNEAEFLYDDDIETIYRQLIYKIANAPTKLHVYTCAILIIPQLDRKLKERD